MNDGFSLTQIILIYFFFLGSSFFYLLCFILSPKGFNHKYDLAAIYSFSKIPAIYLYLYFLNRDKPKDKETGIAMGNVSLFPGEQNEINYNEESAAVWNKTDETTLKPKKKPIEPKNIYFVHFFIYGLIDALSRIFLIVSASFYPKGDIGSTIYPIFTVIIISYAITYFKYNYEYINKHVTLGFIFYLFGVGFVCAADVYKKFRLPLKDGDVLKILIGMAFAFIGEALNMILYFIHQNNVHFNKVKPLKQIGLEGLFGSSIMVVLLIILQFSKCSVNENNLFYSLCMDKNVIENSDDFFSIVFSFSEVEPFFWLVGFIIACSVFNILGIFVVQNTNALFLELAENCKIIPLGIIYGISAEKSLSKDYFIGMIGFSFMALGCVLFTKILRCSCLEKKRYGKYKARM